MLLCSLGQNRGDLDSPTGVEIHQQMVKENETEARLRGGSQYHSRRTRLCDDESISLSNVRVV